jgi:hypothetical protein
VREYTNRSGRLAVITNRTVAVISMISEAILKQRQVANTEATTKHALKISVSYSEITKSLTI